MNIVEKINEAAEAKTNLLSRNVWLYLLKTAMGGLYISFGVIASCSAAKYLYPIHPSLASLTSAIVFPIALLMIIFLGGELFTSGIFVMSISFFSRKTKLSGAIKTCTFCYAGNFVAIFVIMALYSFTKSYNNNFDEQISRVVTAKMDYSVAQLLVKGALCNFAVCCAYYASVKVTSETAKFLMIFICIFAFVISGFEHSVANMGYFSAGLFLMEDFPIGQALWNLLFSTLGNIIGGAMLLGLPIYLMERKK